MKKTDPERKIYPLQQYGFSKNSILGKYRYGSAREGIPPHYHPKSFEICFLLSGRQIYHVDRRFFSIQGGDCFITYPGESHSTGGFPEEKGALVWLILGIDSKKTPPDLQKLIKLIVRRHPRNFKSSLQTPLLLRDLLKALESRTPSTKSIRVRKCIISVLIDCLDQSECPLSRATSPAISKALIQIQSTAATIRIADLARLTGLSISRFKGRFKQEIGFSPQDYLLRKRVDNAIEMLRQPGANVTKVAFETGFSSSQYFATVFKRYTRHSPRTFLSPRHKKAGPLAMHVSQG